MKKIALLIFVLLSLYGYFAESPNLIQPYTNQSATADTTFASAYENRKSNIQVIGSGTVIRNLQNDTTGIIHQKFIIQIPSGQTLLISHNIDIAPRINSLREGDAVDFYGEYEWNPKGGVVHWTHHDPGDNHIDGWLKHNGTTYQ